MEGMGGDGKIEFPLSTTQREMLYITVLRWSFAQSVILDICEQNSVS